MFEEACSDIQVYLKRKGINLSLDEICKIFEMYYSNSEITASYRNLATLATIDHILGRDIMKDIRRFYFNIVLLLTNRDEFLLFLQFPLPPDYLMAFVECKRFLKFVSIFKRLFLNDLTKDIGNVPRRGISFIINSQGNEEFAFALAQRLGFITRKNIAVNGVYAMFGTPASLPAILSSLGCVKPEKSNVPDNFEKAKRIEIDRELKIKLYCEKGLIGNYVTRKEGKRYVIRKVNV